MKKFIYIGLIALAGLFATSCQQEDEKIIYHPSEVVAPTLGTIDGGALSADGANITIDYGKVDFGVTTATSSSLYIASTQSFDDETRLTATITDTTITFTQPNLNSAILNLGGTAGSEFTVYFQVRSSIANDKGTAVSGTESVSPVVSAVYIPYDANVFEVDKYEHVWVIGNYCGWAFDNAGIEYLYNYAGDGTTYSGVIDFGGASADGWKLTGKAEWDDSCNWGLDSSADAPEAEASSITLISSGGSSDIKVYSKNYYHFSFDTQTLVLKKNWGADKISLCGSFNSWDVTTAPEMKFNSKMVRFYVDVTLEAGAEFKAIADGAWDLNWGVDCKNGGDNVSVTEAGNYRVYLDLNNNKFYADASMYNKEEPGASTGGDDPDEPVVSKPSAWSLIGTINGSNWDTDTDLTNLTGDTWVIRSVSLTATDEFKIRADHDWSTSWGGPEANAKNASDSDVYKPTVGTKFSQGSYNIMVGEEGVYDITLDYANETILIEEHVAGWSLIGEINDDSWNLDVLLTEGSDGVWTSPVVSLDGGFKIRYDYSWDVNYGAESASFIPTIGEDFTAVANGSNITVAEPGEYKVSFNPTTLAVNIYTLDYPETMYMIGQEFGAWDWSSDGIVEMIPVNGQEGQFWTIRYFTAENGFKFCQRKEWNGDFCSLGTNDGFTTKDGNCYVESDGYYLVHIDVKRDMLHVEPARVFGIGNCFGGWDEGMESALFTTDGTTLTGTLAADGEIRLYAASSISNSDWWTREFIFFDGQIAYRGNGGDQDRVSGTAGQKIILDFNAGTATVE